ncbi:Polyketide hydroxylase WhiE VIII [Minicystis rosea]|nr:Polyketide hydroxylase WhiE VIII [Minicystis rosea]
MNQHQAKQAAPIVDRSTNAEVETQVLIVGGSIVGLTTALACQRRGIHVLLAEKHASSSVHPRASRYNARAMEVFRALDVERDVRAAGADLENAMGSLSGPTLLQALADRPENHAAIYGRMRAMEEELSPAPSARAPQNRVEPVLRAVAEARGGDLRFSSEVVELTQTPECVTARILHRETGASQLVRARYAVVADGAGGKMRERLGIGREHLGVAGRYVNILFDADLRSLLAGRAFNTCFLQRPDFTALLHAFDHGRRWRLQMVVPHADQGTLEPLSRDRCIEIVRAGMGIPDLVPNIIDAQRWEAASAMALAYRSGRVLLAGDAAHQMTPFLGLGAATGIEDANNLAWKLSFVLRGLADDGLLDTYEAERLPAARRAVIASSRAADENGLPKLGRSAPPTDVRTLLSLDDAYRSRAIAGDDDVDPDDEGQPGRRVPHAWLRARDGSRISTLDLAPGELVLLSGPDGSSWREAAERLSSPVSIRAFHIGGEDLAEETGRWCARAGIRSDGALLVRPDGVVAWRSLGALAEPAIVRDILEKILGRSLAP